MHGSCVKPYHQLLAKTKIVTDANLHKVAVTVYFYTYIYTHMGTGNALCFSLS